MIKEPPVTPQELREAAAMLNPIAARVWSPEEEMQAATNLRLVADWLEQHMPLYREAVELPACAAVRNANGFLFAGKRHGECLVAAIASGYDKRYLEQGFMTTLGRFVDRAEAMVLMLRAGRKSADPGGYRGETLFSEDLY